MNKDITGNKINNSKNIIENLQWGDVLYVDLDNYGIGSEQKGIRYAIVVQNDIGNKYSPTIIVALVTSQINKAKLPLIHVEIPSGNFGFPKDSVVLLEQLRTLDKRRIIRRVGRLDEITSIKIEKALGNSTARKLEKKTSLERLPIEIQNRIINSFEMIKTYKTTIEIMEINNIQKREIDRIIDKKRNEANAIKYFCYKNNLNFEELLDDYNSIKRSKSKSIAL
jgi:mRNA interferase MazF